MVLRHQVTVLRRSAPKRLQLRASDRLLFVWLYRLWPGVLDTIVIVKPDTVVRWHRRGFRAFWRYKSRGRSGRPRIPKEIRDLIREVSLANPLWGAPRIHGELLKLGIEVAQTTVAKYMARGQRPPSQSWKTFLRNHAEGIVLQSISSWFPPQPSDCCSASSSCAMIGGVWRMSLSLPIRRRIGSLARSPRPFLGTQHPHISSGIGIAPTERCLGDGSEPWASGIALLRPDPRGKTATSNV